jgi:hypothetical protein
VDRHGQERHVGAALHEIANGEALDGSGPLEVVDGPPQGGDYMKLDENSDAFIPEYHPEEIYEMAAKLYQKAKG